jgi:hypothetical protein
MAAFTSLNDILTALAKEGLQAGADQPLPTSQEACWDLLAPFVGAPVGTIPPKMKAAILLWLEGQDPTGDVMSAGSVISAIRDLPAAERQVARHVDAEEEVFI